MKFMLVTSASRPNKLMGKYFNHLDIGGIPYKCYPNNITQSIDGTMAWCIKQYRKRVEDHPDYDRLIFTDAWDVLTWATREEVEGRLAEFPPDVVFAAERNCWPEANLAALIEHDSPWRYLNGGMLTGSPEKIIEWCDEAERHISYCPNLIGQQWLNHRLFDKSLTIRLDRGTRLFYCMHLEKNELKKKDGRMWNSVLDTYPLFVHFNGNWPWGETIQMMEGK